MKINSYRFKTGWFACAVTRGYEQKVYKELSKLLNHPEWSTYIYDMFIPQEKTINKKNEEKIELVNTFKGVIYINMVLTDEVYNVIKIDGFRTPLPAKDPVPIPSNQMEEMFKYKLDNLQKP